MFSIRTRIAALFTGVALALMAAVVALNTMEASRSRLLVAREKGERARAVTMAWDMRDEAAKFAFYAEDYSFWDDLITAIGRRDVAWIDANIASAMETSHVTAVWVLDRNLTVVFQKSVGDHGLTKSLPFPKEAITYSLASSPATRFFTAHNDTVMEVRASRVCKSNDPQHAGPHFGYLIAGHVWDARDPSEAARRVGLEARLVAGITASDRAITPPTGYRFERLLKSWDGGRVATLVYEGRVRGLEATARTGVWERLLLFAFVFGAFAAAHLAIRQWVTQPLRRIGESLQAFSAEPLARIAKGRDELAGIAVGLTHFIRQQGEVQEQMRQKERALRELAWSEDRLSVVLEASGLSFWDADLVGGTVYRSDGFAAMLGYEPGEVEGDVDGWKRLIHPDDADRAYGDFMEHLAGTLDRIDLEYRVRAKSGAYLWVAEKGRVVAVGGDGKPTRAAGTFADITSRKRSEAERESLSSLALKLSEPLTVAEVAVVLADHARAALGHDAFFVDLYDRNADALRGVYSEDTGLNDDRPHPVEPNDRSVLGDLHRRLVAGESVLISRRHGAVEAHPFGASERVSQSLIYVPVRWQGATVGIASVQSYTPGRYEADDLAFLQVLADQCGGAVARAWADEAVREGEARYRSLFAITPVPCILLDTESLTIVDANDEAVRHFGYSHEEFSGLPVTEIRLGETADELRPILLAAGAGLRRRDGVLYRKRDGTVMTVDTVSHALTVDGRAARLVVVHDVTERRRSEEKLKALADELQRSNRELTDFASVASHDLQEPLRKIQAFGDRLVRKHGDAIPADGKEFLDRMMNATKRMQTLIEDLLSYSRVTTRARPFAPTNLAEVLAEVVSDLETRIADTGGTVEMGDMPVIDADAMQMRQLIQNLIGNALKFRKPDEPSVVKVSGELFDGPGGRMFRLTVADNGIGFDNQYADRIFRVFERLHGRSEYEGTGVGLAICRKIAERHGGTIQAFGVPDEGATMTVVIPAEHPEVPGAE